MRLKIFVFLLPFLVGCASLFQPIAAVDPSTGETNTVYITNPAVTGTVRTVSPIFGPIGAAIGTALIAVGGVVAAIKTQRKRKEKQNAGAVVNVSRGS